MGILIRKIIEINEGKCNGCGACAAACHEGAIKMIEGKAKLTRDDYCDGLGDCLPVCPTDAIRFVEREAEEYNEAAVKAAKDRKHVSKTELNQQDEPLPCGCPGTQSKAINHEETVTCPAETLSSQLRQWPVQIQLVPVKAAYFDGANLLVAADCAAYAYGDFHSRFIKNKVTLIGCPKLDSVDYTDKLTEIIKQNNIKSVTIVRMEVPCCGGIENAGKAALQNSGKFIPWQVVTISTNGSVIE